MIVYVVMGLYSKVEVMGRPHRISATQPEIIGFMPVFKCDAEADKFCGSRFQILPVNIPSMDEKPEGERY